MRPKLMSSSASKNRFIKQSSIGKELSMATRQANNNTCTTFNVDEEYSNALRTKSFVDMWSKAHHHLVRSISSLSPSPSHHEDQLGVESKDRRNSHSSPLSYLRYAHLSDFLLEPSQETLLAATASAGDAYFPVHSLLLDYFDTTSDACTACTTLLASIDRARSHHRSIRRLLLKLSHNRVDNDCTTFAELKSHVELENPLSPINLANFNYVHACYPPLVARLTAANRRIARRAHLTGVAKKASGVILIGVCGAAAVAALVIAAHAVVGIGLVAVAAAPAVAARPRVASRWMRGRLGGESYLKRAGKQVDAAARGAYIVGSDLDTVSRMVRRAHDEVEHGRDVARLVLRIRERRLVREAAREVEGGEEEVAAQLNELEEHIYLCLITINRSRRMVAQEMMGELARSASGRHVVDMQ